MTTTEVGLGTLSEVDHGRQLRRAVVASTVGTVIEAYDFLLYGQVAGLVFAKLYFPGSDPLVGTLQAFAIWRKPAACRPADRIPGNTISRRRAQPPARRA